MTAAMLTRKTGIWPNPMVEDGHARAPVNKLAALVVGPGTHYDYKAARHTGSYDDEWKLPPPTYEPNQNTKEMRGVRFGRFVVVGFLKTYKNKKVTHQIWLCRCACGVYCARKSRAIQNPANSLDRCSECRNLMHLKRRAHFIATGKSIDPENFA